MDKYSAQLATYAKFLDPSELQQIEKLLRTGKFGAHLTNGLITDAGRADLGIGRSRVAEGTTDILGQPVKNTPGIAQSRQNLLEFIKRNTPEIIPQAGPPDLAKINQAAQNGQIFQNWSSEDLQILDDVANNRPDPKAAPQTAKPSVSPSSVIPDAKPIMSDTKPAPAAPQPSPQVTSTPSGSTKVGTTPTPRGKVTAGFRYNTPTADVGATPTPTRTGMPGINPPRVAGEVVEKTPGFADYIADIFSGGKKNVQSGAKGAAGAAKNINNAMKPASLLRHGGRIAAGGGILSVLAAAGELGDTDDPVMRNVAEAGGNLVGGWGGAATGAALGTAILPGLGTVIGGIGGGIVGSEALSNLAGGLYDMVTNETPEERARKQLLKNAEVQRQIRVADMEAQIPMMASVMDIKRADDFQRAERELQVQNDYNYANAVNQALINAQQQAATQELAMTQFMMS